MGRPRNPIATHFIAVSDSEKGGRKGGAIQCKYCGRIQAAGNPQRCQKHLDECPNYLVAFDTQADSNPTPAINDPNNQFSQINTSDSQSLAQALHDANNNGTPFQQPTFPGDPLTPNPQESDRALSTVQANLGLTKESFNAISKSLESSMESHYILGSGLHTQDHQTLLQEVVREVHALYPAAFSLTEESIWTRNLTALAHIINRRIRRSNSSAAPMGWSAKVGRPPGRRSDGQLQGNGNAMSSPAVAGATSQPQVSATPVAPPAAKTSPAHVKQPFGTITIIAERADGSRAFMVCRPSDLLDPVSNSGLDAHRSISDAPASTKPPEDITVNDVRFSSFKSLLEEDEDVAFDISSDKIVFTFTGGRVKAVTNEVVWRVALEEMFRRGNDPFVFSIFRR